MNLAVNFIKENRANAQIWQFLEKLHITCKWPIRVDFVSGRPTTRWLAEIQTVTTLERVKLLIWFLLINRDHFSNFPGPSPMSGWMQSKIVNKNVVKNCCIPSLECRFLHFYFSIIENSFKKVLHSKQQWHLFQ